MLVKLVQHQVDVVFEDKQFIDQLSETHQETLIGKPSKRQRLPINKGSRVEKPEGA